MIQPKVIKWAEAPNVGIPQPPAMFSDIENLWVSYESGSVGSFAIVRFGGVIDHHLTPINDEGLMEHPYAKAGLDFYSFHEILGSHEADQWAALHAKYWVITFKDNTLDVLARSVEVLTTSRVSKNASLALLGFLCGQEA